MPTFFQLHISGSRGTSDQPITFSTYKAPDSLPQPNFVANPEAKPLFIGAANVPRDTDWRPYSRGIYVADVSNIIPAFTGDDQPQVIKVYLNGVEYANSRYPNIVDLSDKTGHREEFVFAEGQDGVPVGVVASPELTQPTKCAPAFSGL